MVTTTNITAATPVGSTTYTAGPAIFPGNAPSGHLIIYSSTARDTSSSSTGTRGTVMDTSTRTSQTCFMRGIKERIEIQVADSLPWQWRRICFTIKATRALLPTNPSFSPYLETSSGFTRVINQPSGATRTAFEDILFEGTLNADWSSPITAKVDRTQVTLKYDRTITIASGNEGGVIRKYSYWHPMNKNLVYDDEEVGGVDDSAHYSVTSKAGMGDYIIADYFMPRTGAVNANQLSMTIGSSLYWHER